MKKSITKKAKPTSRKRPKSVLRKAWDTRRKNAAHRALPEAEMNRLLYGDNADTSKLPGILGLAKATPTSETETPRSEPEGRDVLIREFGAISQINSERDDILIREFLAMANFQTSDWLFAGNVPRSQIEAVARRLKSAF